MNGRTATQRTLKNNVLSTKDTQLMLLKGDVGIWRSLGDGPPRKRSSPPNPPLCGRIAMLHFPRAPAMRMSSNKFRKTNSLLVETLRMGRCISRSPGESIPLTRILGPNYCFKLKLEKKLKTFRVLKTHFWA